MTAFASEKEFEQHIRDLLKRTVATQESGYQILESKGISDIVICREGAHSAIFFIELKYSSRTPKGELNTIDVSEKIQSEILLKRPEHLDSRFMWLLGSASCEGDYWLMNSENLLPHITTNPLTVEKMNNISLKIFRGEANNHKFNEEGLIDWLRYWLTQAS